MPHRNSTLLTRRSLLSAALLPLLPGRGRADGVDAKAIDTLAREALKAWKAPGLALAVVRGDDVVYLGGHGLRAAGKTDEVTPNTLFPLASCSKAFTTAALALLVDAGKLAWGDPVRKHLPWFRLSDALADRAVTVRDLVTHRTGLGPHELLWYRAPWSPEDAVRRAGLLPLDKPFRSVFQYQSTMFTAGGLVAAAAAGAKWQELLQERLFDALGLRSTLCVPAEAAKAVARATGHRLGDGGEPEAVPFYVHAGPDAAGTVFTTARDLSRWLRFQLADKGALAETHTPQIPLRLLDYEREVHDQTHQVGYGMAWVVQDYRGHKLVSHAGAIDGFRAHLTLVPGAKLGLALLNNLEKSQLNLALSYTLVDRFLGLPERDWHAHIRAAVEREAERVEARQRDRRALRQRDTQPSLELAAYAGAYEHPAYGTVRIEADRDDLKWSWNTFTTALSHFHHDVFDLPIAMLGNAQVVFSLDAGARVSALTVTGALGVTFRRAKVR
jgi:CubicO group peptidase (beta-lactamase class C family)